MSRSNLWGPKGFEVLKSLPRLYYKVEDDGGVLITGTPAKCVFSADIPDGGKVSGGLKMDSGKPVLFGDHHFNHRRLPLRWVDLDKAEKLPPPKDRRNTPGQHPWKVSKKQIEEQRTTWDRIRDQQQKEAQDDSFKWVPPEDRDRNRWVPKESYEQLAKERDKLRAALKEVEGKIEDMRKAAADTIAGIRAEFRRRMNVRSVHLEATLTGVDQIEGHKTEHWEVGDKKYLVIAETPSGLGRGNWADDITRALNRMAGMEEVAVAIVPQGASVRVVELVPIGGDQEDDLEAGQF